jgi:broad specificity phosphatase PhoE
VIRHGETDWNKSQRFQGQSDIPLNQTGREQAARLAAALREILPFQRVVASDLSRARETAEIVHRGYTQPIITDPAFREMGFGDWEGLDSTAIQARWPGALETWRILNDNLVIPGGESFETLYQRVWPRFLYWTGQKDYARMAIVTHGCVVGVLTCGVLGLPPAEAVTRLPGNTGVVKVLLDGEGRYKLDKIEQN